MISFHQKRVFLLSIERRASIVRKGGFLFYSDNSYSPDISPTPNTPSSQNTPAAPALAYSFNDSSLGYLAVPYDYTKSSNHPNYDKDEAFIRHYSKTLQR
jgi:hypothetical protein